MEHQYATSLHLFVDKLSERSARVRSRITLTGWRSYPKHVLNSHDVAPSAFAGEVGEHSDDLRRHCLVERTTRSQQGFRQRASARELGIVAGKASLQTEGGLSDGAPCGSGGGAGLRHDVIARRGQGLTTLETNKINLAIVQIRPHKPYEEKLSSKHSAVVVPCFVRKIVLRRYLCELYLEDIAGLLETG